MKLNRKVKAILVIILLLLALCWVLLTLYKWELSKLHIAIETDPNDQKNPAIYNNIVVWVDNRNGNQDIYGYDLSTFEEIPIATDSFIQLNPAIYGDTVVWEDYRNGNIDIYGYDFSTSEMFQITEDESHQEDPAIYGDIVVWTDNRNGNRDIYGYNLSTEKEFQITTDESHQEDPAIYGDHVVWTDNRKNNCDIYGYILSINQESLITLNPHCQEDPAIYGDTVVWEDYRNGNRNIYGYDLYIKEMFQITRDLSDQLSPAIYGDFVVWTDNRNGNCDIYGSTRPEYPEFKIIINPNYQEDPAIYGDTVVWADERNGNRDIYGYNLSTEEEEFQITTDRNDQEDPAIYGDFVVWVDNRNGNRDIYGYNLSTEEDEFQITTDESHQEDPAFYGNFVVWVDNRNGNRDIYGYNFEKKDEFQITTDESHQEDPAFYGNFVVWVDNRNGNRDIYGYNLSTEEEFQITTNQNDQWSPAIYGDVVVWRDDRNGNRDIYGYSLSTEEEFQITKDPRNQEIPAIYGDVVVWTDERNGNRDIYGYIINAGEEFWINTDPSKQENPAIYAEYVAWVDERNGNRDIYGYRISISPDKDHDRHSLNDCNDNDPSIYPGAKEVCWDIKDNNCNGQTNEGCFLDYFIIGILFLFLIFLMLFLFLTTLKSQFFLPKFEPIYPNPYVAGNPIRSRDIFFGREDVFEFIRNKLSVARKNISIVLHGERRTGKTSILYQIENGELGEQFVPVYIDLQEMARVNEKEFFSKITEKIIESFVKFRVMDPKFNEYFEINGVIKEYETKPNPYLVLDDFLDKVSTLLKEKYLILMFDEYEILEKKIKSNNLSSDLIQYLRSQMQSRERFSFIFAGSKKLEDLEGKYWSLMFNVATYKKISFLEKKDALDLMGILVENRIYYNDEAINKILRLTACHPYFLQLFLQNLVDYLNDIEKNQVEIEEVIHVVTYLLDNPSPHMIYIWQDSTDNQKMILSVLSEIIVSENEYIPITSIEKNLNIPLDTDAIKKALKELYQKEILNCRENSHNFRIDLLRYWIKTEHPLFKTLEEIP